MSAGTGQLGFFFGRPTTAFLRFGLAGLLSIFSASCHRGNSESQEFKLQDLQVELGTAGVWTEDRPNQLRIQVTNRGAHFQGKVRVQGSLDFGPRLDRTTRPGPETDHVVYELTTELPSDSTRELIFPVDAAYWQRVDIDFIASSGRGVQTEARLPQASRDRLRILVVGESLPNLGPLFENLGQCFQTELSPSKTSYEPRVSLLRPRDLPARFEAFAPFELVCLYGTSLVAATSEAHEALRVWVERGGTLVAFPGPEWDSGVPSRVRDLLGITSSSARDRAPPELAARLSKNAGKNAGWGYYREIQPREGTATHDGGISYTSRPGAGHVTMLSARPEGPSFPSPEEGPGFHAALRDAFVRALSFAGKPGPSLARLTGVAPSALAEISSFRVPQPSSILAGLTSYFLLGFLLPAWLFRRRHREWTYAWIVASAVVATAAFITVGLAGGVRRLEIQEINLVRLHSDGRGAEATSYVGFVSPRFQRLSPQDGAADADTAPLAAAFPQAIRLNLIDRSPGGRRVHEPLTLSVSSDGRAEAQDISLRPNGQRSLRLDYPVPKQNIVTLRTEESTDQAPLRRFFTHRGSRKALAFLVFPEVCHFLGEVTPNDERPFWPPPSDRGNKSRSIFRIAGMTHYSSPSELWDGIHRHVPAAVVGLDAPPNQRRIGPPLKNIIAATIWGLVSDVRGLSPFDPYSFQVKEDLRPALRVKYQARTPAYLLLVSTKPFVPLAISEAHDRRTITLLVVEIPRQDRER